MNICMSIGYPIKTSRSPSIHNAGYKKLGIDDEFIYLRAEVKPEDLKQAMDGARAFGIQGISVTMPHKQTVMQYLNKIDKDAKVIGAVNTIINKKGKLIGYNTDWIGALKALEHKIEPKGKKVAVIGAGGAARAIVYGLKKKGSIVTIFNRSLNHAKKLAKEFNCKYLGLDCLEQAQNSDVIINATSIGMNEDKSPIHKKFLNKNQIIFDIVYSPKETRLIKDAKKKGAKIVYGYEMLLYQGMAQFKLYTGLQAPEDVMRKTLEGSL
ncbi:shikimate dehydrogenase [Candidatus Daviesbacteria bacterium]|nr:shikimate dehydrogenase [Candidatus Daviesbacteria bacterium]